jgi:hypothetical protein
MSLSGKVLIACCLVASLAFVYLAGRTYETHRAWGSLATERGKRIDELKQQQTDVQGQIKEAQDQIERTLIGWGPVWDNVSVAVQNADPEAGPVTVIAQGELAGLQAERVAQPEGAQPPEPRLVHAFVINESAQQYVGEFIVRAGDATSATLETAVRVPIERIQQAQASPWRLRALIPDGQYKARLRDRDIDVSLLLDEAQRRASTAAMWQEAAAGYERQRDLRSQAVANLQEELSDAEAQRDSELAENTRLTEELAQAVARRDSLIEENRNLTAQLAELESLIVGQQRRTASATRP